MSLLLAFLLCLILTACTNGSEAEEDTVPSTIKDLATGTSVEYDYSDFIGAWSGEDDSVLIMEHIDGLTISERFTLSDTDNKLLASGNIQYVEEYDYVYFYNEHDGIAHICWFNDDDTLYIDSFGTFTKMSGDVPGDTVGDNAVDNPLTIDDSALGDPVEYDYSAFMGTWTGTDGTKLTVEEGSIEGAPFVLLDRLGNRYTGGILQYVKKYDCVYANDDVGNLASKCSFNENNTLEISGFSTFSKVNGDESDYIVIRGTWYPGGDTSASRCIEFDSSGTMWSIYERNTNGLWDGVNGGTLRVTGVNRYKAISDWHDGETFDCYLENDKLYWGSENDGYEEYY